MDKTPLVIIVQKYTLQNILIKIIGVVFWYIWFWLACWE